MGIFLWETPDLPTGGDRRVVVEVHLGDEVYLLAAKPRRDHRSGFGVATEARAVRHLDPFVMYQWLFDWLQRLRQLCPDQFWLGLIGNHEKFAIDEAIGTCRVAGARCRHGRQLEDIFLAHDYAINLQCHRPVKVFLHIDDSRPSPFGQDVVISDFLCD